ncbi:MAG: hypothetical protein O2962_08225 [Cyanobacteria bacterium]|nr:hypothetical protein [Cyanobacteriota bacterium]
MKAKPVSTTPPREPKAAAKSEAATPAPERKKATQRSAATALAATGKSKPTTHIDQDLDLNAAIEKITDLKNKAQSFSIALEAEIENSFDQLVKDNLVDYLVDDVGKFKQLLRRNLIPLFQIFYKQQRGDNAWQELFQTNELLTLDVKIDKKPEPVAFAPKACKFDIHHFQEADGHIVLVVKPPELKS